MKESEKMNLSKVNISIVIPIYRNAAFIDELYSRLTAHLSAFSADFEILFVNDGSPDHSWELIEKIAKKDSRVKGICFSRNFGQHIAVTAGVCYASGDWVVVMDGDLQDRPEEIINLYRKAIEGYDVVFARRVQRKDPFLKRLGSVLFYKLFDLLAGTRSNPTVAGFGIYSRPVIGYFNKMQEHSRVFTLFIRWLGFKTAFVDVEHAPRAVGKSAYSFSKKMNLAIDAIVSMSNNPLKLSIKLGFFLAMISLLYGVFIVIKYLGWGVPVMGWTSLIVSIYFLGGLLLSTLGILGLYIGKIYDEVKNRPLYVIKAKVGISIGEK